MIKKNVEESYETSLDSILQSVSTNKECAEIKNATAIYDKRKALNIFIKKTFDKFFIWIIRKESIKIFNVML